MLFQARSHRGDTEDAYPVRPSSPPPLVKCLRFASPASSFGALCHDSSRRPCFCPDCAGRLDPAAAAAAFHWLSSEVRPLGDAEMLPSQVPSVHYTCCITEFIRPAGIALQVPAQKYLGFSLCLRPRVGSGAL